MAAREPATRLCAEFSGPGASAVEWGQARRELEQAELFWLSSVRPDGRPHVAPLLGVWLDDAFCFSTGSTERKAKNLAANAHCIVTTGRNVLDGLDIVVEGTASGVDDDADLRAVAAALETKYGAHFAEGGTWEDLGDAIRGRQVGVWRIAPTVAFGFAKGASYSQTRWSFA
jgi:pyridoxamine 5'-phosphate oxidase-like protein